MQRMDRLSYLRPLQNYAEYYISWRTKEVVILSIHGKSVGVRDSSTSSFSILETASFLLIFPPLFLFVVKVVSRFYCKIDQIIEESEIKEGDIKKVWEAYKKAVKDLPFYRENWRCHWLVIRATMIADLQCMVNKTGAQLERISADVKEHLDAVDKLVKGQEELTQGAM